MGTCLGGWFQGRSHWVGSAYETAKWRWFQIWVQSICLLEIWTSFASFGGFTGGTSGNEPTCQCKRHKRYRFFISSFSLSPLVLMELWIFKNDTESSRCFLQNCMCGCMHKQNPPVFFPDSRTRTILITLLTPAGCPTTQLWYHLPGDSIKSHRFRAQSFKTSHAPISDANHEPMISPVLLISTGSHGTFIRLD